MSETLTSRTILGCVLAGGLSKRMGSDKSTIEFEGKPLALRAAERLRPQVAAVVVNTNVPSLIYSEAGLRTIPDTVAGHAGPLAGILAALKWAKSLATVSHVATVAVDTPFFPETLVERLSRAARRGPSIAIARSDGRLHPVFGLWPVALAEDLERWLRVSDRRSVHAWADTHGITAVDFEIHDGFDPFFNVNTAADLALARRRQSAGG